MLVVWPAVNQPLTEVFALPFPMRNTSLHQNKTSLKLNPWCYFSRIFMISYLYITPNAVFYAQYSIALPEFA